MLHIHIAHSAEMVSRKSIAVKKWEDKWDHQSEGIKHKFSLKQAVYLFFKIIGKAC
jgi:hypothetical protein